VTGHTVDILLVEDNPNDVELAMHAFREDGVCNRIEVARDGQEALDYLLGGHGHKPQATPRLVLLDLKLPKVGGLQVLREIRSDPALGRLPVVILTNSCERSDIVDGYELHANSYITKPVEFDEFVDAARTLGRYWLSLNEPAPALSTAPESLGEVGR
jgi:two-component system response regulator